MKRILRSSLSLLALILVPLSLVKLQAQTFTVLHNFARHRSDGAIPYASLVLDAAGNLYGTTSHGGTYDWGTVFKLDPTGKETVLYNFTGGVDGGAPRSALLLGAGGNLYGTTVDGGDLRCSGFVPGCGTVFKVSLNGKEKVLHAFTDSDGAYPFAGLVRDSKGNLYGTTVGGGDSTDGTVFKLNPNGAETVLYNFPLGGANGCCPDATLLRDPAGNLYGTSAGAGAYGNGTIFKIDTSGNETVLYSFVWKADGAYPQGPLVRDSAGNLYGTAQIGGSGDCNFGRGCGVVFKLDTNGIETVLYSFTGGADGAYPFSGLVRDPKGNLYGTTSGNSEINDYGTVFKIDPAGHETVLHNLTSADGKYPQAGVVLDAAGNIYGTTMVGGSFDFGTVFKITP